MMTKQLFIDCIEGIEKQLRFDELVALNASMIYTSAFRANLFPDNHWVTNAFIKSLQVQFKDETKDSWIEYYLWELDFGKKYKDGCVTRKDKSIVNLSDAGNLYEWLIECRE